MRDRKEQAEQGSEQAPERSQFDQFEALARRLVNVPKDDVREAEAREHERRNRPRTA